jgi:hypothetical protein
MSVLTAGSIWVHETGGRYKVISTATGKSSEHPDEIEGVEFAYYLALTVPNLGKHYVRPLSEFLDGRFQPVTNDAITN